MKPRNTTRWRKRRRIAVSQIVGVIIMIAVTLTVGFAAWAWARSAAVNAETNFGKAIQTNVICLNENFVITNANFSLSPTNSKLVTVWFFNNGNGTVNVSITTISNSTWSYNNQTSFAVKTGTIVPIRFNVGTSFTLGKIYTFNAVARCQGDIVANYQQVR